ncbi:hypothetical protein [Actinophytocola sp.]|uniref:hypothetical protein n=1 Tax=Actinophytocola sp. TaxID=1872138 RepID=UPI002D71AB63|nr:hypothetical protein [Actinophytocola sp.]HYQ69096.1 hypothetical protein [Actinophytocola sp.]
MARRLKLSKEIRPLINAAEAAGWTTARTRSNHLRLLAPNGVDAVLVSHTASDWRARNNLRADLKRHGVAL